MLNKEFKNLRLRMGLNQAQFAKKIGVSVAYINQIDSGLHAVSEMVLKRLGKGLKTDEFKKAREQYEKSVLAILKKIGK